MKKCPVCDVFMNEVVKVGVLIDVCPQCRGTWLDKGEMEKIQERLKEVRREWEDDYREPPHRHDRPPELHYKKKKHKKWTEIFDIFD